MEKCPYLAEKLGIILIPTMVMIVNGKTNNSIRGFDEFGGVDDFSTADMAYVLSQHGIINAEADRSEEIAKSKAVGGLNHVNLSRIRAGIHHGSLSDDEDDFST